MPADDTSYRMEVAHADQTYSAPGGRAHSECQTFFQEIWEAGFPTRGGILCNARCPPPEEIPEITPKVTALKGILKGTEVREEGYRRHLEKRHL